MGPERRDRPFRTLFTQQAGEQHNRCRLHRVVRQVKARFFHLFDRESLKPQHAEVDILLEEYIDESVAYREVHG